MPSDPSLPTEAHTEAHAEPTLSLADWLQRVDAAIVADNQRPTRQRRLIAETLFQQSLLAHRHLL